MKITAVIPAAGRGSRVGTPTPKQFWKLYGKSVLVYTLEVFAAMKEIAAIVVPVAEEHRAWVQREIIERYALAKVQLAPGGESRHDSIHNGLLALQEEEPDVVVVHDAVRPFVYADVIRAVANAAFQHGAAGTVLPLVDTVLAVTPDGFMDHSLVRAHYRASQTPQAFRYRLLLEGYAQMTAEEMLHGTECLAIAQQAGAKVKLVPGSPALWKVTYKQHIYAAEAMMKERLRQVAIVTGGSQGIGAAIARGLADRGIKVAVVARSADGVKRIAEEIHGLGIPADVSDPQQVAQMFRTVQRAWGRIDILVNNAGIAALATLAQTTDEIWERTLNTNLSGAFYCTREALRVMQAAGRGGLIINIGSSSVSGGRVGQGAYAASKTGLIALTETAALEGKSFGIHAFTIVPRRTDTGLRQALYPDEDPSTRLKPEEVAQIAVFVATEWLAPLSGQTFWVR